MTKATYRKKALKFLLEDFERRCAYCLDPNDFRHPSQDQVDHFNCKLKERQKHQYKNLMLACAACNNTKHDKPIVSPFDPEHRFINCTEENEFDTHITEHYDGRWIGKTKAGQYHIVSIGLDEECHRKKRAARRELAEQILKLLTTAIFYRSAHPIETHTKIMEMVKSTVSHLDNFPPLVVGSKTISVREWLRGHGLVFDS